MLTTLMAYNAWANRRVLESLNNGPPESKALQLMAHILVTEKIWLGRLAGRDTMGTDKSPRLAVADCESLSKENQRALGEMLDQFASSMDTKITYRNLSGKEFTTSVADILTHVMFHGAYHRGQIALAQRTAGNEPVGTDYILFEREQSLSD
jgi:uncharacterized damage-inducible protein DinB